jgi:signal transduction histidine kinase
VAIDINKALETTLTVARNELKYLADVSVDFDKDLPIVDGYAGELNQVFLNLLINAAHAIQDVVGDSGRRGVITVRTVADDGAVLVSVSDTGSGIPVEIRHRIFDPFFTTKAIGKGTGQGLAIARSVVVEKHGGKIWFTTEAEHGTSFYVRLPAQTGDGEENDVVGHGILVAGSFLRSETESIPVPRTGHGR